MRQGIAMIAAVVTILGTAGCKVTTVSSEPTPGGQHRTAVSGGTLQPGDPDFPMAAPNTCTPSSRNGQPLPDRRCTPGTINPDVTQDTIDQTICKVGWTKTVRPSSSVTGRMKVQSARSYGYGPEIKGEYDHLIPLELGGAPDDPRNLWMEIGRIPNPKDAVEHKLNDAVCSGLVPLATAQKAIAVSWVTAYDDAGLRINATKVCLRQDPTNCAKSRHGGGAVSGDS